MNSLKDLISYIGKKIVDNPEQVKVTETLEKEVCMLELNVHKSDVGTVIGKQGKTIRALRTILHAASTKMNTRSFLNIKE